MPKPTPAPKTHFRYPAMERALLGTTTVLLWGVLLGGAGLVVSLVRENDWGLGLFLFSVLALFTLLANIVARDFLMKRAWQVSIGKDDVSLHLPTHRLLFGKTAAFSGTLELEDIKAVEWREEATETVELVTINRVYALRLSDGRVLVLGEDRPVPRTEDWSVNVGNAARALANAIGKRPRRLPMVRCEGGVLALWTARRPAWPEGSEDSLSAEDERSLYSRFAGANLLSMGILVAFLVVFAVTS